MIDKDFIDQLGSKITGLLPAGVSQLQQDIESNIRALLQSQLGKLNLVTREEFEVQTALLQRTREKLDQLVARLESLHHDASERQDL